MTSFLTSDVLAACVTYGPQLHVPAGVDPIRIMKAIASNESSTGVNCGPRHEPAYEATGALWAQKVMAPLMALYPPVGNPPQSPAAMSYGPWQQMFCNFTSQAQAAVIAGTVDLATYAQEFVLYFNSYVIRTQKAQNLAEIGEVYNSGGKRPDPGYVYKLQVAYNAATPD